MGCKSGLYAVNNNAQALAINGIINFGNVVRRFGCHTNMDGGNVILRGSGYYTVMMKVVVTNASEAAITPTITLYKDGTAYSGALATETIAVGATRTFVIPCMIRETCDCDSTITAVLTGAAATINNATITVVKI